MTTTRTASTSNPSEPNTGTRRPTTDEYSTRTKKNDEHERQATRSERPHLCIVINWCGPASGRPEPALRAVGLATAPFMIVPTCAGSSWC
jgi:hypothetical protein